MQCPKCAAQVADGEKFCTACGASLMPVPAAVQAFRAQQAKLADAAVSKPLRTARGWLLAVAILTLLSGIAFYFIQQSAAEKQIAEAEASTAHIEPAERDRLMREAVGMSFQEAIDHDRGMVTLMLVVNITLALIYFVLWYWARTNAFTAALVALLLFGTVWAVSAMLEPATIYQGILIKILFVAALIKALQAGSEERKLRQTTG